MKPRPPAHPKPDEEWADMVGSFAADELVAGKLIAPDQWSFARDIIAQQVLIPLLSNCRPIDAEISD